MEEKMINIASRLNAINIELLNLAEEIKNSNPTISEEVNMHLCNEVAVIISDARKHLLSK